MRYVDEFRDPAASQRLVEQIRRRATRRWTLMEVCGGQTHSLLRHGIDQALQAAVDLIHGPGCPVCVTPAEAIDGAIELSQMPGVLLTSFGDMLRVPGSRQSLLEARSAGGCIRTVYSPLDALQLARRHPQMQVVFFAVGFETTVPATALAVRQAYEAGISNFRLLTAHVRVLPAMHAIAADPHARIDGFLAAGHVCAVTGFEEYADLSSRYRLPIAVTGFEPVDLLQGIMECVDQLESGRCEVTNCYGRAVRAVGNRQAQALAAEVFEICDRPWRGLGLMAAGGLRLREKYRQHDADRLLPTRALPVIEPAACRSGEVLSGRIKPSQCASFGSACTPQSPLGAPMVSSEGACAAYYRYRAVDAVPSPSTPAHAHD